MTTDSFPLRLDTSTGVIKFIETDSDDLIVLAAKCGLYLASTYDSAYRGRWEFKSSPSEVGFVGTIEDTHYENNSPSAVIDSAGFGPLSITYHLGLVDTNNVNQKQPPSGDTIVHPLRFDRTLNGLQEIGDSGGNDEAYTHLQDTLISLMYQHDLPGVYRMAPSFTVDFDSGSTGFATTLDSVGAVQEDYLDSDEWTLALDIPQEFKGSNQNDEISERVRIYQKTGITPGSATDTLINSKRPDGGLRLLKSRAIGPIFIGVGTMAGNDETSPNLEIQEYFAGGLLNRLFKNQGTSRAGNFQFTYSSTPPAGYRNIGKYLDLRPAIVSSGGVVADFDLSGGSPTGGGQFSNTFAYRYVVTNTGYQDQRNVAYGSANTNQWRRGRAYTIFSRRTAYRTKYFSPTTSDQQKNHQTYYLHVKI
jgi:hypothetical protein